MDTVLLSIYRLVDSEMKILYDAVQVYYYYTPQGNQRKSLKHFASGLTTLIKLEGKKGGYDESNLITGEAEVIGDGEFNDDDAISIQSMEGEDALSSQLPEENTSIHHYLHQSTNQYSISYLLWEFFHGVVLKFTVEELSQYPIWRSKIRTILGEVEGLPGLDATVAGGTQVVSSVLDHSLFASLSRLVFNFHREIMHIYGTGSLMNYLYGFQVTIYALYCMQL